jgi:hypothetical protein
MVPLALTDRPNASGNSPPTWGLQAHALRMAAEGAVAAYEHVAGVGV